MSVTASSRKSGSVIRVLDRRHRKSRGMGRNRGVRVLSRGGAVDMEDVNIMLPLRVNKRIGKNKCGKEGTCDATIDVAHTLAYMLPFCNFDVGETEMEREKHATEVKIEREKDSTASSMDMSQAVGRNTRSRTSKRSSTALKSQQTPMSNGTKNDDYDRMGLYDDEDNDDNDEDYDDEKDEDWTASGLLNSSDISDDEMKEDDEDYKDDDDDDGIDDDDDDDETYKAGRSRNRLNLGRTTPTTGKRRGGARSPKSHVRRARIEKSRNVDEVMSWSGGKVHNGWILHPEVGFLIHPAFFEQKQGRRLCAYGKKCQHGPPCRDIRALMASKAYMENKQHLSYRDIEAVWGVSRSTVQRKTTALGKMSENRRNNLYGIIGWNLRTRTSHHNSRIIFTERYI